MIFLLFFVFSNLLYFSQCKLPFNIIPYPKTISIHDRRSEVVIDSLFRVSCEMQNQHQVSFVLQQGCVRFAKRIIKKTGYHRIVVEPTETQSLAIVKVRVEQEAPKIQFQNVVSLLFCCNMFHFEYCFDLFYLLFLYKNKNKSNGWNIPI